MQKLSDASVKDIEAGRALMEEARLKTLETKALCDLITAQPVSDDPRLKGYQFEDWERLKGEVQGSTALRLARDILEPLTAMHFPIAFPEVFLGRSQGFNVILGNPPWEKVKAEEREFLVVMFPGLRGASQRELCEKWQKLNNLRPDLRKEWRMKKSQSNNLSRYIDVFISCFPGWESGDLDLYKAFCFEVYWHFVK